MIYRVIVPLSTTYRVLLPKPYIVLRGIGYHRAMNLCTMSFFV
nr:MAG TPA_asm: hypothetical protein [Caudoviricetes sp.]